MNRNMTNKNLKYTVNILHMKMQSLKFVYQKFMKQTFNTTTYFCKVQESKWNEYRTEINEIENKGKIRSIKPHEFLQDNEIMSC